MGRKTKKKKWKMRRERRDEGDGLCIWGRVERERVGGVVGEGRKREEKGERKEKKKNIIIIVIIKQYTKRKKN